MHGLNSLGSPEKNPNHDYIAHREAREQYRICGNGPHGAGSFLNHKFYKARFGLSSWPRTAQLSTQIYFSNGRFLQAPASAPHFLGKNSSICCAPPSSTPYKKPEAYQYPPGDRTCPRAFRCRKFYIFSRYFGLSRDI